jgi:hypothetical protein
VDLTSAHQGQHAPEIIAQGRRRPWAMISLLFPSKLLVKIKFPISLSSRNNSKRPGPKTRCQLEEM